MEKAAVFLENNLIANKNVILENLIRSFEFKIYILPSLNNVKKNYELFIYVHDSKTFNLLTKKGFKCFLIDQTLFDLNENDKLKKIKYNVENWYEKQFQTNELTFKGVNIGETTKHEFYYLLSDLLDGLQGFESIIEDDLSKIFIENRYSKYGKVIKIICESRGIEYEYIYSFYGKIKSNFIKKMTYILSNYNNLKPINLYSINKMKKTSKTILFDVPYINYLKAAIPVMKFLMEKEDYNLFVMAKKEDITLYNSVYPFQSIELKKKKLKKIFNPFKRNFKRNLKRYISNLKNPNTFYYGTIDLWPFIVEELQYLNIGRIDVLYYLENFEFLLDKVNPNVIVVGDDRTTFVRSNLLYALKRQILLAEIQHGLYLSGVPMANPISHKIFVWGEKSKVPLLEAGGNIKQLQITGSPIYDSLISKLSQFEPENSNVKKLLFATQPLTTQPLSDDMNLQIINNIIPFLEEGQKIQLIVKPHPFENSEYYRTAFKRVSKDIIDIRESKENIFPFLLNADLVLLMSSTVGIEAAIMDKPMVCIKSKNSIYTEEGVALEVQEPDEIVLKIKQILYDKETREKLMKNRKKFVHDYAYVQDGKASERIAQSIIEMVEGSSQ